jgi:hypothetical protein
MDSGSLPRILRNILEASFHFRARRALSPSTAINEWNAYQTKLRFFTTEDTGDTKINFKITQSIVEAVARVKFPVSLLEAVATGLPVVLTDAPGNGEWVVTSENG